MATIIVTTLNDEFDATPADNGLSLREAIDQANNSAGADRIGFAPELAGTIRLTEGAMTISDALTIAGDKRITVSGDALGDDITYDGLTDVGASKIGEDRLDDNSQIFLATTATSELNLFDVTLTGGRSTSNVLRGGAVNADEGVTVTVIDSVISGNSTAGAGSRGGAIYTKSTLNITSSVVSGNRTEGEFSDGGGLFGGTVTIIDSSVTSNLTFGNYAEGGGVASSGEINAASSFFSGNQTYGFASSGGGLFVGGGGEFTNNTLFGNLTSSAFADGAGIFLGGAGILINNTLTGNATLLPGSYGGGVRANDDLTVEGNIFVGNASTNGADLSLTDSNGGPGGPVVDFSGLNIIGSGPSVFDPSVSDSVINADPTLIFDLTATVNGVIAGVAADNGGPVNTVALLEDVANPALDASGPDGPATDARGGIAVDFPGVEGNFRDLGAVEAGDLVVAIPEEKSLVVTTTEDVVDIFDGLTSLREAVAYAEEMLGPDTITFAAGGQGLIRLTQGELTITESLEIDGGGKVTITGDRNANDITVAGDITDVDASLVNADLLADNSRIFSALGERGEDRKLTLSNLTLTGGRAQNDIYGGGGAISGGDYFDIEIQNSTISGNSAARSEADGGAINANAFVSITNSTLSGNRANGNGGAVYSQRFGISITSSTVTDNFASGDEAKGGGLFITTEGQLNITNSIILGNAAGSRKGSEVAIEGEANPANSDLLQLNGTNIIGAETTAFDPSGNPNVVNAPARQVFDQTTYASGVAAGVLTGDSTTPVAVALRAFDDNPALDAASSDLSTDVTGAPRLVDQTRVSNGGLVDLGAAELQSQAVLAPELEPRASIVVTTTADVVDPNDGLTSLREAVAYAEERLGPDTITFAAGGQGLIRLTQGELTITESLEIDGGGKVTITGDRNANDITVAGDITDVDASLVNADLLADNSRIFSALGERGEDRKLTLSNLTLTGGRAQNDVYGGGGAISGGDYFDIEIQNSTISGNSAARSEADGGAINANAFVSITNSTLSGNRANGNGGAVYSQRFGISITSSTITDNFASGDEAKGGGLFITTEGQLNITNSIILGNAAGSRIGSEVAIEGEANPANSDLLQLNGANIIGAETTAFDPSGNPNVINAPARQVFAAVQDYNGSVAGALFGESDTVPIIRLNASIENPALDRTDSEIPSDISGNQRSVDLVGIDNGGAVDLGAVELQMQIAVVPAIMEPTNQADVLVGTAGEDLISGLRGADTITGLGGADTLNGNGGRDDIKGNGGRDEISGGGGRDIVSGGGGRDRISGDGGRDVVSGDGGRDDLSGGGGRDLIDGGRGRDTLDGGNGADTLVGGKGNDVLTGGGGLDTFQFTRGDGRDRITDFDQLRDTIQILDGADSFDDLMITQVGNNVRIKFANVVITVEDDQVENFTAADFMF